MRAALGAQAQPLQSGPVPPTGRKGPSPPPWRRSPSDWRVSSNPLRPGTGDPAGFSGPLRWGRRQSPPVSAGVQIRFQFHRHASGWQRGIGRSRCSRRSRGGARRLRPPCFHVSAAPAPARVRLGSRPSSVRAKAGRRGEKREAAENAAGDRTARRARADGHVARDAQTYGKCSPSDVGRFSTHLARPGQPQSHVANSRSD